LKLLKEPNGREIALNTFIYFRLKKKTFLVQDSVLFQNMWNQFTRFLVPVGQTLQTAYKECLNDRQTIFNEGTNSHINQ